MLEDDQKMLEDEKKMLEDDLQAMHKRNTFNLFCSNYCLK